MNKRTEELIEQIVEILTAQNEENQKESPDMTPSLVLSTTSQSEIDELEREFQIRIPGIQKRFIRKYNTERFHLMDTDIYGVAGLRKELKDYVPDDLLQEGLLPFAGSEGDYYCLNMEQDEDKVYIFSREKYYISGTDMTFEYFFQDLLTSKTEVLKKAERHIVQP